MQRYPPTKFALVLCVFYAIVYTLASAAGVPMSEILTTNITITWGTISICQAIEWHAAQR